MSSISHEMRRDAQKSPEELEHEINATRAELEDTLEELEARFSPNELFNQALSRVREHGGEFTQNLGDSIKQNPLPTLLTSIGIAWLMAANGQRADGDNGAGSLRRRMHDTRDAMHRGREKMSAARERASSTVQRGQESMREGMDSMREGIESSRAALARSSAALRSGAEEITS
ncbi:MAG TPA: DUF3618 domain-containing protein, partial [Gammaproteobacteria bacterium]|nr:DUF3618 domain-containing protein [Gammaproteobacteria bacterium]